MEWRDFYYRTHHIVQGIRFLCLRENMFIKELYIHFSWIGLPDRSYNCFRMSFAEKGHFIMSLTQFPYFFSTWPPHYADSAYRILQTTHFTFSVCRKYFFLAQRLGIAFNSPSQICRPSFRNTTLSTPSSRNPKEICRSFLPEILTSSCVVKTTNQPEK